ncbi:MAG: uracil-DNA glycosylase [Rubellimicrobium sp.]|nr:uracil-DNA glycosylase [Rubellimicrobium sp.]
MESSLTYMQALDALRWQVEMGVSDAIGDAPLDRHAQSRAPAAAPAVARAPAPEPDPAPAPVADPGAAATLAELAQMMEALPSPLKPAARRFVFADGRPEARLMILGEAPGRDEDREGRPFVGRAGQLLDRMLAAIGIARDHPDPGQAVYIANILPWRPPANRTPSPEEIAMFLPFALRHIRLAAPEFLLLMGNTPCQALLGRAGITRLRGNWHEVQGLPALPTFHPAYLLRNPAAKRESWADLLAISRRLQP